MIKQCRKEECKSTNLFMKPKGQATGLYCEDCGAWQKWITKDEITFYERINDKKLNKQTNFQKLIIKAQNMTPEEFYKAYKYEQVVNIDFFAWCHEVQP